MRTHDSSARRLAPIRAPVPHCFSRTDVRLRHTGGSMATSNEGSKLLDELLRAGAPAGDAGPAAKVWRDAAGFAELSYDGIGSTIARVGEAEPLVAIVGHIDEIGVIITPNTEKGFPW